MRRNSVLAANVVHSDYRFVWKYRTAICPKCKKESIEIGTSGSQSEPSGWRMIHPVGASRGPVRCEVPVVVASDYVEACNVLPISVKASAALARRCLQNILHGNSYKSRDLAQEIDLLLKEPDPARGISLRLRQTIDGIRNFGNFSAHPIDDKTTLQIIDVELHEAEWCLETIEELFEHFYPVLFMARLAMRG